MPYKVCPLCNQSSYSASERDIWFCPYCGEDMTFCEGFNRRQMPLKNNLTINEAGFAANLRLMPPEHKK